MAKIFKFDVSTRHSLVGHQFRGACSVTVPSQERDAQCNSRIVFYFNPFVTKLLSIALSRLSFVLNSYTAMIGLISYCWKFYFKMLCIQSYMQWKYDAHCASPRHLVIKIGCMAYVICHKVVNCLTTYSKAIRWYFTRTHLASLLF